MNRFCIKLLTLSFGIAMLSAASAATSFICPPGGSIAITHTSFGNHQYIGLIMQQPAQGKFPAKGSGKSPGKALGPVPGGSVTAKLIAGPSISIQCLYKAPNIGDNEMEIRITGPVMADVDLTQCTLGGKTLKNTSVHCAGSSWEECKVVCP